MYLYIYVLWDLKTDACQASWGAFAALLDTGAVVTWGDRDYGGDSRAVSGGPVETKRPWRAAGMVCMCSMVYVSIRICVYVYMLLYRYTYIYIYIYIYR